MARREITAIKRKINDPEIRLLRKVSLVRKTNRGQSRRRFFADFFIFQIFIILVNINGIPRK